MLLKHWYKWLALCVLLTSVLSLSAFVTPGFSPGETFVVTNINDAGDGSLRQAILDANANSGADTIKFTIESAPNADGIHVIAVETLLPPLTDAATIDGTSQPGYSADNGPVIEINGMQVEKTCAGVESGVYRDNPGLDVVNNSNGDASGTTIMGLKVSHFCQGISISASFDEPQSGCADSNNPDLRILNITVQDNVIEGNLDGNGAVDLCRAENSTIKNNKLYNNGDHLEITRSQHVVIEGNEGSEAQDALELVRSQQITVKNNRFSHSRRNGIVLVFEASNNQILDNEVTDVAAMGLTLSNDNIARGNTIMGAGWFGIEIRGGSNNTVSDNIVKDNGLGGIAVNAGAFLFLDECSIDENGNPFDCEVKFPLSEGDAFNNVISNNEIAFNHGPGIVVGGRFEDSEGVQRIAAKNRLSYNLIYANEGLGIDLSDETQSVFFAAEEPIVGAYGEIVLAKPDGPTPNDTAILANNGQNFPVLTSALATPGRLVVKGTLDTPNPQTATIELFANLAPTPGGDPSGHGEGATFLGTATTNAKGEFTAPLPSMPVGTLITATATDMDGNTSEYAQNIAAQFPPK